MRCSKAEELMSLSLDGEASPEQIGKMREHIGTCTKCFHRWEALRHISSVLYATPMTRPANSLVAAVMRRIDTAEAMPSDNRRSPALFLIVGLAALGVVVAGNLFLFATGYAVSQLAVPAHPADDMLGTGWKLFSLARLFGDVGWGVTMRFASMAQQVVFATLFCASLALAALWAHILRNYRGVQVRR